MNKFNIIVLSLIVTFAFLIRLSGINFGLPSENLALSTYNPDEQNTYHTIEKWKPSELKFPAGQVLHWGNLHLMGVVSSLAIAKIAGYIKTGNRDFFINNLKEADRLYIVGRMVSVILGTLSVLAIYFLAVKIFNSSSAGLFCAYILAILPMHVVNSFYVRPDVMMMFFLLLTMYFSIEIVNANRASSYIYCGLFLGLSAATKYSAGSYVLMPILAHFLRREYSIGLKERIINKNLILCSLVAFLAFIIGCPYAIVDVYSFIAAIRHGISLAGGSWHEEFGHIPAAWRYITWYLPYGMGIPFVIFSAAGFLLLALKKKRELLLITISGALIFFITTRSRFQAVWHTFPVIPFFVLSSGYFVYSLWNAKKRIIRILSVGVLFFVFAYSLIYSLAVLNLYRAKNTRKEASEWIEKNISYGSKIAIARSYFWTPGILRQYNPPYKLLMGGDPVHSSVGEAVLGLEKILSEAEYVVLTEYEYRSFLHPKLEKYFPKQAKIIKDIFSETRFKKIAELDKEAKFLWFTFKRNYPPSDWLIPNPEIVIFKKK